MKLIDELKLNFVRAEGLFRLILINITIFLAIGLVKVFSFLADGDNTIVFTIIDWLGVKASLPALISKPWTIITYMFVHENFMHILFNMLILFWFGKIFCDFISGKKLVVVYLLGGIAGALLYMLAYNIFPAFSQSLEFSKLIGASAGVIAILVAIATLVPDYSIQLLFFGPVRLKFIAIFLILLYVISIPDGNAGGNISHLGGAAFGFIYTRSMKSGLDIGSWLEKLIEFISGLFSPNSKLKMVHRKSGSPEGKTRSARDSKQDEIDSILDKISKSGFSSLSTTEKETLFNASKNKE